VDTLVAGTRDARLARWATSALASSLAFIAVAIAAVVVASDVLSLVREHPVGTAVVVLLVGCYATSFVCLHKLQRGTSQKAFLCWAISFVAAVMPLVALIYWLGPLVGSLVGFAEIISLAIHLVALAEASPDHAA
jgi:hypothetical protein